MTEKIMTSSKSQMLDSENSFAFLSKCPFSTLFFPLSLQLQADWFFWWTEDLVAVEL